MISLFERKTELNYLFRSEGNQNLKETKPGKKPSLGRDQAREETKPGREPDYRMILEALPPRMRI